MKTFWKVWFLHKSGRRQIWISDNPPTPKQLQIALEGIIELILKDESLKNTDDWGVVSVEAFLEGV